MEFIPIIIGNSELGRWLQVDPLAAKYPGWSPYNYTMNNPIVYIDPNGMYTKSFIHNTYYFHRFTISEARFATYGEGLLTLWGNVLTGIFQKDPSFGRSDWNVLDNPFSRDGLANIYDSKAWKRFNVGINLFEQFNKWEDIQGNFIRDEYAFNYALSINKGGIAAFRAGNIVGFNNDGSPIFEPAQDGTTLELNPAYVSKFYDGNYEEAAKEMDKIMELDKSLRFLFKNHFGVSEYRIGIENLGDRSDKK